MLVGWKPFLVGLDYKVLHACYAEGWSSPSGRGRWRGGFILCALEAKNDCVIRFSTTSDSARAEGLIWAHNGSQTFLCCLRPLMKNSVERKVQKTQICPHRSICARKIPLAALQVVLKESFRSAWKAGFWSHRLMHKEVIKNS